MSVRTAIRSRIRPDQMAVGPYIAGIDTLASTQSFLIYAVLKNPDIRARGEATPKRCSEACRNSRISAKRSAARGDRSALRRYPVAPFTRAPYPSRSSSTVTPSRGDAGHGRADRDAHAAGILSSGAVRLDRHMSKSTLHRGVRAYRWGRIRASRGHGGSDHADQHGGLLKFAKLDLTHAITRCRSGRFRA